jgi:hypothetical protein
MHLVQLKKPSTTPARHEKDRNALTGLLSQKSKILLLSSRPHFRKRQHRGVRPTKDPFPYLFSASRRGKQLHQGPRLLPTPILLKVKRAERFSELCQTC